MSDSGAMRVIGAIWAVRALFPRVLRAQDPIRLRASSILTPKTLKLPAQKGLTNPLR